MKKLLSFTMMAALVAGLMSCNKQETSRPVADVDSSFRGSLSVKIGAADETKAADTAVKDFRINSAQLFVFDDAGLLETDVYKSGLGVDNNTSITINTKTGTKTVYALVNNSRLYLTQGVTTLAGFEATLTDLGENSETNLVMSGKNTVSVVDYNQNGAGGTAQPVSIFVKRLAARIQLDGVTVDFRDGSLKGATFRVDEIYLKNVVGKSPIGMQGLTPTADIKDIYPVELPQSAYNASANWYNKMTKEVGAPACVDDSFSTSCTVEGVSTAIARSLFTFPNNTDGDSNAATWGIRHTRLVIKAHVVKNGDGVNIDKDTYYVLDLPVLKANWIYEIQNVNITMLGKDDDNSDEGIRVGRENYTITVDPWTGTTNLNYEF